MSAPLCAKNYQSWWKFDEVLTKTILHHFLEHGAYNFRLPHKNGITCFSCDSMTVSFCVIIMSVRYNGTADPSENCTPGIMRET